MAVGTEQQAEKRPAEERRSGERRASNRRAGERGDARLRRIIEHLADGIVIVDGAGTIRFVNPAAEQLFARSSAQLMDAAFGFPIASGEPAEVEIYRRDGVAITVEMRAVPIEWESEPGQLVSLRDVTDRHQAEERKRQLAREQAARAEAEAASHAKSEFLAVMSHELRTPLNAVLGYSELLELGLAGPLNDAQREQLGRIRMSGRHLLGLVNEVLDLAKVEAGRLTVRSAPARAADAIASAVALAQPEAEARGLKLTANQAGEGPLLYLGEEERVIQILLNLLTNAAKFTEPGGRIAIVTGVANAVEAGARLHGVGPWTFFRVSDTGIGIPEEKLEQIFAPFVQAERGHTRSHDGPGLGLTISRRLARLMDGDLTVRSALGRGSVFTLWLPHVSSGALARESPTPPGTRPSDLAGLAQFGECLLREVEPLLDAIVARLRSDAGVPGARALRFSQLADHLGTLLADVAETLVALEESDGEPSPLLSDGTDIQRLVADRHGAARARFKWTRDAVRREYAIIGEELERALTRGHRRDHPGHLERAIEIIRRLLDQAERHSLVAFERVGTT